MVLWFRKELDRGQFLFICHGFEITLSRIVKANLNSSFKFMLVKTSVNLSFEDRRRRRGVNIPNPLSTFCYLSAQRDALGQLVDGQLAVEVALLRRRADLDNDRDGDHDGDEEEAHAVDDDLHVSVVGGRRVGGG